MGGGHPADGERLGVDLRAPVAVRSATIDSQRGLRPGLVVGRAHLCAGAGEQLYFVPWATIRP